MMILGIVPLLILLGVLILVRKRREKRTGKREAFTLLLLLFAALPAVSQTIQCGGRPVQDCPHSQEIQDVVKALPAPSDWDIIIVPHHAMWRDVCADHCEIPAYTVLASHRTYLDIERVYATAGLRRYMAHELGHILTNSTSEKIAEAKGQELLKSLQF